MKRLESRSVVTLEEFWCGIGRTAAEGVQLVAGHELVRETKVCNLDVHLTVQQQVLSLQIPAKTKGRWLE